MPVTPLDIAQLGVRRKNFSGNTDKYMPFRASPIASGGPSAVVEAVRSELGFLDTIADTGIYTEFYRLDATKRLARYKHFARFYEGKHWDNEYDDGEKKPVFNFCQVIIDKGVDFFASKSFSVGSIAGNEDLAAAVEMVWEYNTKDLLTRKLAITASILGDSFLYVTLETKDAKGVEMPQTDWKVRLYQIDPFFCFPVFDDLNPRELKACLIQMPVATTARGGVAYKSIYITPTFYQEVVDGQAGDKIPNPFGCVNVVHFPNYDDPLKVWGQSDLDAITPLNEEYNIIATSVRKIIKYHAEPTTLIFGARASRLEKGAKKVWSGLPETARVENLAYEGNLEATYKYLAILEQNIHKLSSIPSVLYDSDKAVSHTSAIAMKMLYQPMLEKTERKQQSFTSAFQRTTKLILKAFEISKFDYLGLVDDAECLEQDLFPVFPDPIPYDEMGQLDTDQKKFNLGVVSLAALIRKYNPKAGDNSLVTTEILADRLAALFMEMEKARALMGMMPNPEAVFLSSLGLDPLIRKAADQIMANVPKEATAPAPEPDSTKPDV